MDDIWIDTWPRTADILKQRGSTLKSLSEPLAAEHSTNHFCTGGRNGARKTQHRVNFFRVTDDVNPEIIQPNQIIIGASIHHCFFVRHDSDSLDSKKVAGKRN
jgi:hypothetical protein